MKRITILILICLMQFSCNDEFLELRPLTQIGESPEFWENESSLEIFSDGFYRTVDRHVWRNDFESDNMEHIGDPPQLRTGIYAIPTALGSGGWNWEELRNLNYFIQNVTTSSLDAVVTTKFIGLARFFRAWFYYNKVRRFGDVPIYTEPLESNDEEQLFKPRDPRTSVMNFILDDLNNAIQTLSEDKFNNRISKWTALALKSRICLYEGTWRNYHTEAGLGDGDAWLNESVAASQELMNSGEYGLFSTGDVDNDYFELFQPEVSYTEEVILSASTDNAKFYYTPLFTSTSNGNFGGTKSLVSTYLMANGQTFQEFYPNAAQRETMSYFDEMQNRDPRLSQTFVYPGYVRVGTSDKAVTDFQQNVTGYMNFKRVGPPSEDQGGGFRDVIMIRYGEVLLNLAEAKAELGTITQQDLDNTVNLIRGRVGIPPLTMGVPLDPILDARYSNTSDPLILEIRRERRVELMIEGFRTDDIIRWKEGQLFREQYEGIYIPGFRQLVDLDNDGNMDLYVYPNGEDPPDNKEIGVQYYQLSNVAGLTGGTSGRLIPYRVVLPTFQDWEYFKPIPTEELTLNPNLEQNPGWD